MSHTITGIGLDSSLARLTDSHLPVLAQGTSPRMEECWGGDNNAKTVVVVAIVAVIVVTIRRPTIIRIVDPRPAAFSAYPRFTVGDPGQNNPKVPNIFGVTASAFSL